MNLVFIRSKTESTVFMREQSPAQLDASVLEEMKISAKAGSSSKNIILGLQRCELISQCEEWKFWNGPLHQMALPGQLPVRLFPCEANSISKQLRDHVAAHGQPDVLWVEGTDYPQYLAQIFELCPSSFKMVYSKDWRPWKIEKLDHYDLCLVDEEWEAEKVKDVHPHMHCGVWDKLIDYQTTHFPIACEKVFDLCYVAYMRGRKNHELLFRAMSRLPERKLTCVCVGDDRKGNKAELEKLASNLQIAVHFAGEVSKEEVNRLVNQSRVGVLCAALDAAPRAILEYMAADVPVLVNSELLAGSRYVGTKAGVVESPAEFHLGITELLDNRHHYSPRAYFLEHYSFERVMAKFIGILKRAGALNRDS